MQIGKPELAFGLGARLLKTGMFVGVANCALSGIYCSSCVCHAVHTSAL